MVFWFFYLKAKLGHFPMGRKRNVHLWRKSQVQGPPHSTGVQGGVGVGGGGGPTPFSDPNMIFNLFRQLKASH